MGETGGRPGGGPGGGTGGGPWGGTGGAALPGFPLILFPWLVRFGSGVSIWFESLLGLFSALFAFTILSGSTLANSSYILSQSGFSR